MTTRDVRRAGNDSGKITREAVRPLVRCAAAYPMASPTSPADLNPFCNP